MKDHRTAAREMQQKLVGRLQGRRTGATDAPPKPAMKVGRAAAGPAVSKAKEEADRAKSDKALARKRAAKPKDDAEGEVEEQKWNAAQWLQSLALHEVVAGALDLPEAGQKQYNYIRKLDRERLEAMLAVPGLLAGMCDMIMEGVREFQAAGKGSMAGASGDKFQSNAKFQMSCAPPAVE